MTSRSDTSTGLVYGFAAYGMWGLLPLYWHLLQSSGAIEILAHRMAWSMVAVGLALLALRRWSRLRPLLRQPRKLA
ncbi:protein rarD, partial [Streptomyces varsoviensis]